MRLARLLRCPLARFAAPVAAAAIAGLLLLQTGAGIGLDRRFAELRDWQRSRPAGGEVHLVEIDGRSIAALRRWPWPRSLHGRAVDRLREAGVRTIAFDIDFSSVSTPDEDAAFAAALARAGGGAILSTFTQPAGHGRDEALDSAPVQMLADNAFLATANVEADEDGALRRMPYGGETLGIPRPSLASMVAERADAVGDSFGIDYAIDPATIPRHSFVDLIEGRVPRAALAGRRVIIGSTAVELGDHYRAPRHGLLPGAVIQALAAETLLAGSERHQGGGALPLGLALLAVAATVAWRPTPLRIAALGFCAPALAALSYFADVRLATSYDLVPAFAALAAACVVATAALRRRREHERGLKDADTGLPNLAALEADAAAFGEVEIVVARVAGHAALGAALGPAGMTRLVTALAERLALGSGAARIYRCEESGLSWIAGESAPASLDGLAALARDQELDGRRIEVPLHFGLARGAGPAARQIAANAMLAASQAERSGARAQIFTERDSAEIARNLALMGELDDAYRAGDIRNYYQPKLDLACGRITGVEALVRWFHPERGLIPPDDFVPLIEEHGRAEDLTVHVLRDALAQAVRWRDEARLDLSVAVNVSASLLGDPALMGRLRDMVRASALAPERLTVEVTETAAMADPAAAAEALEAWRALGVGVSIDDFGTGQSSLGYIRMLPATELKIDRSFVGDLGRTPRNAIMVRSTIAMAHELGLRVVAEGVEDEACLAALAAMGCDFAQGYLISKPVPGDDIERLVRETGAALPAGAAAAR
ncbi:MAG: diguanylate cyclase [Sphingomonadales bacterium]|jgi:EAL domain-containing protein (putative c-di-GMP-specific phosphodiesterase class I)/CHASE2 domain-containing sensor protein|nr:diguanylate cyclase [Sphingomonadales bacterium]